MIVACDYKRQPQKRGEKIPVVFIRQTDRNLKTKTGILFYHDQPFSGWEYELHLNGDTAMLVPFENGKEQGLAKQWYENGLLREERYYEKGEKAGTHKGWWANGKPSFEYHFQNGSYEGNQKEWHEAGLLYKESNYKNGKENGLQQLWRYDGKLVANYVAKNGRNYGLTGVKNCKSVWEDEKKN